MPLSNPATYRGIGFLSWTKIWDRNSAVEGQKISMDVTEKVRSTFGKRRWRLLENRFSRGLRLLF